MTTSVFAQVQALLAVANNTLLKRGTTDDAIGREARSVLQGLDPAPPQSGKFDQSAHPITGFAAAALANHGPATSALVKALRPVLGYLPWEYNYPDRADKPGLGQRIAFAEIIGPLAPLVSHRVCLGFTLIAPDTYYPPHHHPATELYYVVAGTALWELSGAAQTHPPDTFVLHPSQAIHAMRTHREPLLAMYTWSGPDVRTTSAYTTSA